MTKMVHHINVLFNCCVLVLGIYTGKIWSHVNLSKTELLNRLLLNYSNKVPPNFENDESLEVKVSIHVNSFDSINESSMDYALSIYLRQFWTDSRLRFDTMSNVDYLTLDAHLVEQLWRPDLFFSNEKQGHFHYVTVPNNFIRLFPDGSVSYSTRLSLVFSCAMRLHKFPLDMQLCKMSLETYAYNSQQLVFKWVEHNPVEINPELQLSQFQLHGHKVRTLRKQYSTGEFSGLQVLFFLKRDLGYYMIQTYIPSMMIVILSWVSFWLSPDAVPARISLGVLTVLTMTTMSSGSLSTLPRVSYIKAMDVWMSTCLLFVFAALLEFAFVNVLSRRRILKDYKLCQMLCENHSIKYKETIPFCSRCTSLLADEDTDKRLNIRKTTDIHSCPRQRLQPNASTLDTISKYIFPLVFIIFNLVYWLGYIYWREEDIDYAMFDDNT